MAQIAKADNITNCFLSLNSGYQNSPGIKAVNNARYGFSRIKGFVGKEQLGTWAGIVYYMLAWAYTVRYLSTGHGEQSLLAFARRRA